MTRSADKILEALKAGPLDGGTLQKRTGLWSIEFYPTLVKMEDAGTLESDWAPGPYPRKRVYRIADDQAHPALPR